VDLETLNPVAGGLAFVLGLIFGSFLNVCIYRLPRGMSVVSPRSACPHCHRQIAAYDNIPVVSWLLLGGRCRHCRARISPRYLLVELLVAALFLACYGLFGLSLETIKWFCFCFLAVGLIFTDAETHLLPDKLTLFGLALGLLWSLWTVVPGPFGAWFRADGSHLEGMGRLISLADSLLGAAIGAGFIYGSGALYLRLRGVEGMGFGDVKLMAMVGAFLGAALTVFTLITASVCGALYGVGVVLNVWRKRWRRHRRRAEQLRPAKRAWHSAGMALRFHEMPFGVFLGSMALAALFFGGRLLEWYLSQF
jgi:leader peptidase (prepilin peptidase)/N-methyltransferase